MVSKHLYRVSGDTHAHVRVKQLGDGGPSGLRDIIVCHPGGLPGQQPSRFNVRCHIGQHELDRLMLGNRYAELLALFGIGGRGFHGGTG